MIRVSKSLYSREVLLKTAFSFTDKVFIHLAQDKTDWIVSWKPRMNQEIDSGEFENELISQTLREELLMQTSDLRRIILARAFASTVMDNQPGDLTAFPLAQESTVVQQMPNITEDEKADILKGWFDKP